MNRINGFKLPSYFLLITLFLSLSACSPHPDFDVYTGKALNIGIIGEPPEIKEEQVQFHKISFDDLMDKNLDSYDAIFIMKENLSQAGKKHYSEVYLNSAMPFFFIAAKSHIPFTEVAIDFDDSSWENWNWTSEDSSVYVSGMMSNPEEDLFKSWDYGLYNDTKTEEHILDVYSRIFMTIEDSES
ncbi:hypothetical protein [Carnobacterium jeotgali]|uniref:hypothetical protein n=1 Tax=Carnobacterium jeotgali TaxID=545534 RepID=UPI00388D2298